MNALAIHINHYTYQKQVINNKIQPTRRRRNNEIFITDSIMGNVFLEEEPF